jgi:hypothetical protein
MFWPTLVLVELFTGVRICTLCAIMKKLLVVTFLSLSLTGCNQAPPEQAAQQADVPMKGDSTLLDSEKPVVELTDSVPHLNKPQ